MKELLGHKDIGTDGARVWRGTGILARDWQGVSPEWPGHSAWLKQTLLESDATFKVMITPTAIVGPDNPNQSDSHAGAAFRTESNEFRPWVRSPDADNARGPGRQPSLTNGAGVVSNLTP